MQHLALVLVLAIGTLLSGCFGSDKPMFLAETAVRALEPGRYGLFEQYGDQTRPSEYMEVRQNGTIYHFVNEKGAVNPVSFHPIAGGLYVAQVGEMPQLNSEKKGYGYALYKNNKSPCKLSDYENKFQELIFNDDPSKTSTHSEQTDAVYATLRFGFDDLKFPIEGNAGVRVVLTHNVSHGYALFKIDGREALVYVVECDKQEKAMLAASRVEIRGQYECFIDSVANPAAFFAGLKRSDPPSRMVRE